MLADVSHELKTPLTSIRGYLETLRMSEHAGDAAARARHLDTARRETERLQHIVQDLVDLARYENGAGSLQVRTFAVERLIGHVVRRHEQEAHRLAVDLRTIVDGDADQVEGDPDRLEQVIENLVSNALRHTPNGGVIEIRALTEPDAVSLSVVDSGTGIGAEHLPHVFDRFYKVDASRSNGAEGSAGSGLGLSIAKAIVERHGGTIRVTSVPGRTEFRVLLPQPITPETGAALRP
jgi:two-component system sensor histidine kinase BaeS